MGIQGLWQVLEPVAEPVTLESLEGKRLAIDISIWLHQAAHGYSEHQLNAKCPHLSLVLRRLAKLLFYKIRPVFVFDGPNVPIFKRKLLRDRQVKHYVEELTMSKAQKHVLQQLASSQLHGGEQRIEELSELFASQTKRRREDDLFDVPLPSSSNDETKCKDTSLELSSDSSHSSEFDPNAFQNLTSRDERVEYLLAVRNKVRGLKLREVPDDSEAFSNLQIGRLLKRNQINEQLQLLRNEALKLRVFSADGELGGSNNNIKLATMEGLERVHIITDDNEVQIIDDEKEAKKKVLMDSLAWPSFLEKIDEKHSDNTEKASISHKVGMSSDENDGDDDDDDDALQEAIHASLLENSAQKCSKLQMPVHNYDQESKGDMIERLRTTFSERAKDLYHDTWSSSTSESSDEFVELLPDSPEHFSGKMEVLPPNAETVGNLIESDTMKCLKENISEKDKNDENSGDGSVVQDSSMRINRVGDTDIFVSTREDGVYKDVQDLLRICGIPFVIAPGEAEAQCCELERLGLVQGIISDDSDVWLFGAAVVYKNMFNQKRRLQMFCMETIYNQLGLSRWEAIQLALLSGGDYTDGLEGVGVVAALELISEFAIASQRVDAEPSQQFQAFENLLRISAWLNHHSTLDDMPSSSSCSDEKSVENARRLKLRRLIEKHNAIETLEAFPSREVFSAYAEPLVDSSAEKPKWKNINMEELESFVWGKLGWDKKNLEKQTNQSLLKWNEYLSPSAGGSGQSYQTHITSFTHHLQKSEQDQCLFLTARVKAALQRLATIKNSQNHLLSENAADDSDSKVEKIEVNKKLKRKRPSKCIVEELTKVKKRSSLTPMRKRKKFTGARIAENNLSSEELHLSEESSNDGVC